MSHPNRIAPPRVQHGLTISKRLVEQRPTARPGLDDFGFDRAIDKLERAAELVCNLLSAPVVKQAEAVDSPNAAISCH
jgi:hypothetical protein